MLDFFHISSVESTSARILIEMCTASSDENSTTLYQADNIFVRCVELVLFTSYSLWTRMGFGRNRSGSDFVALIRYIHGICTVSKRNTNKTECKKHSVVSGVVCQRQNARILVSLVSHFSKRALRFYLQFNALHTRCGPTIQHNIYSICTWMHASDALGCPFASYMTVCVDGRDAFDNNEGASAVVCIQRTTK